MECNVSELMTVKIIIKNLTHCNKIKNCQNLTTTVKNDVSAFHIIVTNFINVKTTSLFKINLLCNLILIMKAQEKVQF
jgi:hypothetical protein